MARDMIFRLFRSFLSTNCLASKSRISPPIRLGNAEGSRDCKGRTPLLPATSEDQNGATPPPIGLSTPIPVITTRLVESLMLRVVITGIGVLSPIGVDDAPFWSSLVAG